MATRRSAAPSTETFADLFEALTTNIERVIQGKAEVIRLVLVALVSEGHLLIEDVPGVGKTSLAKALSASIDASWRRIQFTPDLLPSDVTGVTVFNRTNNSFEFRPGGIFANVVLGDEINRASPKTQSALLEAMEEGQVTVDATTYGLPEPFIVIATQNPIEHEGTYPLPDSQLDRFLMRISVGYPDKGAELTILDTHGTTTTAVVDSLEPVATAKDILGMINLANQVHVAQSLKGYLVDLADATRHHPSLALGVSPRGTLALQRAARSLAAANGRNYVTPDDIKSLTRPVLEHRIVLTPEAGMGGAEAGGVLDEILASVPVPSGRER
ncbi:MAG: AAA family ATPase [Acidimicrobiia bacterium]